MLTIFFRYLLDPTVLLNILSFSTFFAPTNFLYYDEGHSPICLVCFFYNVKVYFDKYYQSFIANSVFCLPVIELNFYDYIAIVILLFTTTVHYYVTMILQTGDIL